MADSKVVREFADPTPFTLVLTNGTAVDVMGTRAQIDKIRGMILSNSPDWINLVLAEEEQKRFTCLPCNITALIYTQNKTK